MSTPQHKVKRKLADIDMDDYERREAAVDYDNLVVKPKPQTARNLIQDALGVERDAQDIPHGGPVAFRDRLNGRLEQYIGRGPDLNKPAFTAPMNRSSVTPERANFDLRLAQEAIENWGNAPKPKSKRHRVRYPKPR